MRIIPVNQSALNAAPDMTVTTTATALPAQPAGINGIIITAHPSNTPGSVIRVASNAGPSVGIPLAPGGSWTFAVSDASKLMACLEASAASARLIAVQA